MAKLIPPVDPREIANLGERDVAMALVEQLPDDCTVYHSYPWLRPQRNDRSGKVTLREGEADFVILHPKAGMLVLEVKGGEIEYDHENRRWLRREGSRVVEIKDPFAQARINVHALEEAILREGFGGKGFPCPYGYAVAFPHCDYTGRVPPGAESSAVFSAPDLAFLGERVTKVLGNFKRSNDPVELTREQMHRMRLGLSPAFCLMPVLGRQVREQEERLIRLTEEQVRLLDFLGSHTRAAVRGVAGSGKTILAMAQALKYARQGQRTLLVCYNKSLADWLESSVPDELKPFLTVSTYHGLCAEMCFRAHMPFVPKQNDGNHFWRSEATNLLLEALDIVKDRFDAIVVDEGQDFMPDWWIAIEALSCKGEAGPLYVFYDPAQNLYVGEQLAMPSLGSPFELPTNCRNTRRIAARCAEIREVAITVRTDAPEGVVPELKKIESPESRARAIRDTVESWINKGKLLPSQIAILSPFEKAKSCLAGITNLGKTTLVTNPNEWRVNRGVLFATIRSFKGLEADAIILTDVPEIDSSQAFSRSDYYVACSRAKHLLSVLES